MQAPARELLPTILLALLLGLGLSAPAQAAAPPLEPPRRLAVVVESSAAMDAPWRGPSRREALAGALQVELRTLPLGVRAGLWLAQAGGAQVLVPPRPAADLKAATPVLPRAESAADPIPALKAALAWLTQEGGGSLLYISAGLDPAQDLGGLGLERGELFVHTLGLGPGPGAKGLNLLALAGGGVYIPVDLPAALKPRLHRAFGTALSTAQLLLEARTPGNTPLAIAFGLSRQGMMPRDLGGVSGRPLQLWPGAYRLEWPAGSGAGPGAPPPAVGLDQGRLNRVWIGGVGELAVTSADADGRPLGWQAQVSRLGPGDVVINSKPTPLQVRLAAGFYRVRSLQAPFSWTVELPAGEEREVVMGPAGGVTVGLEGPAGPLRVGLAAKEELAGRKEYRGQTNQRLRLLPGPYRLRVEIPPGWEQAIDLAPGQELGLALPRAGALLVTPGGGPPGLGYTVLGEAGLPVARGSAGRELILLPGAYQLELEGLGGVGRVEILPGQVTTVEPPTGQRQATRDDRGAIR